MAEVTRGPRLDQQQHQLSQETTLEEDADPAAAQLSQDNSEPTQAVRFKSIVEEIDAPQATFTNAASPADDTADNEKTSTLETPADITPEELRALSKSLRGAAACPVQERRMNHFAYEPFSLPASRTASHEESSKDGSRETSRQATHSSSRVSPMMGPSRKSDMSTPPLTPAATGTHEREKTPGAEPAGGKEVVAMRPLIITPQESGKGPGPPFAPSPAIPHRPASAESMPPPRPRSADGRDPVALGDHRRGLFSLGPLSAGSPSISVPASRETSPSRPASQFYSRHRFPSGDANDPYAASKREKQTNIETRFVFTRKKKHASPPASTVHLPRSPVADKRHSTMLAGGHAHRPWQLSGETSHSRQSSMADLKRFFKFGQGKKRGSSPAPPARMGGQTPPSSSSRSVSGIPFGHDHGLTSKYGKLGRVLGAGAGGSVRLMKRSEDNVVFAVKEFRARHSYESERDYVKKLTAEYCMGSSLHHGNIIETLDIVQEKGKWYEVMEYAPFDLFAIVMTGRMLREEISCSFLQILSGVTYLHSLGLAHRDLKLDNVVVSDKGIMKIIDFGSAHVFRYPFENGIVLAAGIVGSDPYLAPEVYDEQKYDPQAVDIWSLAIIYCCMMLRRFPWKVPRMTDSSFKLFASEPAPEYDPKRLVLPPGESGAALDGVPERASNHTPRAQGEHTEAYAKSADKKTAPASPGPSGKVKAHGGGGGGSHDEGSSARANATPGDRKEVIKGPWRILRLLPRETRHVIGGMLETDVRKRMKMEDILEDPWVADTVICRQMEPGVVISAEDHTHILEPPASAAGHVDT